MIRTTPFHERLEQLNVTQRWGHWSGYLSALKYTMSAKHEYFAVRNSAGFFDTSPLYKYRIVGRDAERFLGGVMTRDIRACKPGRAQYTLWCDDGGYVLEDGVVFRHGANEFLLTSAEPNLGYLQRPGRPARGADRGCHRGVRHARRPGPTLTSDPRASWPPRSRVCRTSGTPRPRSPTPRSRSRAPATPATSATR